MADMQFTQSNISVLHDSSADTMRRIIKLRCEHRDLDQTIFQAQKSVYVDQLDIQRLKKRKLQLKDAILRLESTLIPDINA